MVQAVQRVRTGEKFAFPANFYNDLVAMREQWLSGRFNPKRKFDNPEAQRKVLIENGTGSDLDQGHVVTLSAPLFTPAANLSEFQVRPQFIGVVPTSPSTNWGKFAVAATEIPDGEIGPAVVSGVVQAIVEMDETWHDFADMTDGDATKLTSHPSGSAHILWVESGTGPVNALVELGKPWQCELLATAVNQILAGGGGDVNLYWEGSQRTTVTAWYTWMAGTTNISAGKPLMVKWFYDEQIWRITAAECE